MKKQLVLSLATMMMVTASTQAAPTARAVTRETVSQHVTEQTDVVKKYLGQVVALAPEARNAALDKMTNFLEPKDVAVLRTLSPNDTKALEALASVVATKRVAKALNEKGQGDDSLVESANAMRGLLQMAVFKGEKIQSDALKLKADEIADVDAVADRIPELTAKVTKMDKQPRGDWANFAAKAKELFDSGKYSAGESLVLAIMKTRNCTQEEAIKIIRRMKDCV